MQASNLPAFMAGSINPLKLKIMDKNYYNRLKEAARQAAIEWQLTFGDNPISWNELAEVIERFYTLGKRYGLLKEFIENGIPC